MMIARNSKSYPYLAIAQHYGVPYAEVLKFSDSQKNNLVKYPPFNENEWRLAVWRLENDNTNF